MEKTAKYMIVSVGMAVGGYLPMLFGASGFGVWAIVGSTLGGVASIWVIYRLDN